MSTQKALRRQVWLAGEKFSGSVSSPESIERVSYRDPTMVQSVSVTHIQACHINTRYLRSRSEFARLQPLSVPRARVVSAVLICLLLYPVCMNESASMLRNDAAMLSNCEGRDNGRKPRHDLSCGVSN